MKYSKSELKSWLLLAEEAASRAGRFLRRATTASRKVRADYGKDVKISADTESEGIIIDFLQKRSSLPLLTEESGILRGKIENGLRWIVDPLDGSINFLHGIPISCVCVALWKNDEPLIGVIYDFNRKELFSGIVNNGAWLNKDRISVSSTREINKAVLFTGIPAKADTAEGALSVMMSQIRPYRKARWIGSAALSLAYVSAGRGDAYLEKNVMLWDIAAGISILLAAGGRYRLNKRRAGSYFLYASNGRLYQDGLRKILAEEKFKK